MACAIQNLYSPELRGIGLSGLNIIWEVQDLDMAASVGIVFRYVRFLDVGTALSANQGPSIYG